MYWRRPWQTAQKPWSPWAAAQSNHCRQTAALAARYGLGCILVLSGERPEKSTRNLLLDGLFGAEIVWCSAGRAQ